MDYRRSIDVLNIDNKLCYILRIKYVVKIINYIKCISDKKKQTVKVKNFTGG